MEGCNTSFCGADNLCDIELIPAHSLALNTSALGGTTNMRGVVIVFALHVPNWPEVIYFTLLPLTTK